MRYNHIEIENKWREIWEKDKTFRAEEKSQKPKYYVLNMFPYPSGTGLHVGHPLGYIASDIYARFKRLEGYNVLHPMGYDSFGLPAEQYAIQTGQHPSVTTQENINKYDEQLKLLGLSYDWDRKVLTSDSSFYKWTQWIFIQLFESWFDPEKQKAEPISTLCSKFEKEGSKSFEILEKNPFTAKEWTQMSEEKKLEILAKFRLTYLADVEVNWCPELGTVLANDEVKDGFSERGGYPIEKKQMKQWMMRIEAYAPRLLEGLDKLDWSTSMKEMQRNWIGKSEGALIEFEIENHDEKIEVFSTRPDTIFGASFLVIAPEHPIVSKITIENLKADKDKFLTEIKNKSERQRLEDTAKTSTGMFIGAYAFHPFTNKKIQIWIADYVLYGYGTGAVMAVAGHDERDYKFATKYNLPILPVVYPPNQQGDDFLPYSEKSGVLRNSDFLDNLSIEEAIQKSMEKFEDCKKGKKITQYRLRDAVFSRQRYWGEPFPVYYDQNNIPRVVDELPVTLPPVDEYLPTKEGEPPLARAKNWKHKNIYEYEKNTMPGWAGSSWYFLRYMDPMNENKFIDEKKEKYWGQVDFYLGGSEHATGHLLYSRFWYKFLYDRGFVSFDEPFLRLTNQGMIQGSSAYIYRLKDKPNTFVSADKKDNYATTKIPIDVAMVDQDKVSLEKLKKWRKDFEGAEYIFDKQFLCDREVEKMSKSKYNVVNPDDIIKQYGADTLRLYEMFLGPITQHKPWKTEGIVGVSNFLKKIWRLFWREDTWLPPNDEKPTNEELRVLHTLIQKITYDMQILSYNTSVAAFMIAINEFTSLSCNKKEILEPLLILLSPFAPFIAEELWQKLGHKNGISFEKVPELNLDYLKVSEKEYPVSINGKLRAKMLLPIDETSENAQKLVLDNEKIKPFIEGKTIVKFIFVPNKIINLVVK